MLTNSNVLPRVWRDALAPREVAQGVSLRVGVHYRAHFDAVRRYAYAIVRQVPEAEDVAQEVFVKLIQAMERGLEVENPLPWLLRVAHNVAITRVCSRVPESPLEDAAGEHVADQAPNPEEAALESQQRLWLQQALALLSPQELRCWTLRAEGLRYREIAEVLAIRTGTVATLLVRAAEKLSDASSAHRSGLTERSRPVLVGGRR